MRLLQPDRPYGKADEGDRPGAQVRDRPPGRRRGPLRAEGLAAQRHAGHEPEADAGEAAQDHPAPGDVRPGHHRHTGVGRALQRAGAQLSHRVRRGAAADGLRHHPQRRGALRGGFRPDGPLRPHAPD